MIGVLAAAAIAASGTKEADAKPVGDIGEWVRSEDYPADALRDNVEGVVAIAFQIEPDGSVDHCEVTQSSGSASLDATTCPVFTARARYAPATDPRGRPIRSAATQRIRWQIPKAEDGVRMSSGGFHIRFEVSETGTAENCTVAMDGDTPPGPQQLCDQFKTMKFAINRKSDGTPVRKTVTMTNRVDVKDYQPPASATAPKMP